MFDYEDIPLNRPLLDDERWIGNRPWLPAPEIRNKEHGYFDIALRGDYYYAAGDEFHRSRAYEEGYRRGLMGYELTVKYRHPINQEALWMGYEDGKNDAQPTEISDILLPL